MEGYERVLLVKPKVFVFRIPPLRSVARGYKASDWNLEEPDWKGRMKVVTIDDQCLLKLEDETTGQLYAQAPVAAFPGAGVQPVTDSSRYFVIRVQNETGRTAYLGLGFADRSDSFDLNVALHDHFKSADIESNAANTPVEPDAPKLDLSLKGGISLNLNLKRADGSSTSRVPRIRNNNNDASTGAGGMFLLPPPPGSKPRSTT